MLVNEEKKTLVETITEEIESLLDVVLPEAVHRYSPVELSEGASEIVEILVRAKLSQNLMRDLMGQVEKRGK